MDRAIIILGLKKAAVVLHALAFSFKEDQVKKTRQETLALVDVIMAAVKMLEKAS